MTHGAGRVGRLPGGTIPAGVRLRRESDSIPQTLPGTVGISQILSLGQFPPDLLPFGYEALHSLATERPFLGRLLVSLWRSIPTARPLLGKAPIKGAARSASHTSATTPTGLLPHLPGSVSTTAPLGLESVRLHTSAQGVPSVEGFQLSALSPQPQPDVRCFFC